MLAWLGALGILVGSIGLGVQAASVTLYDNGPVADGNSSGRCDSALTLSCGGTGSWTFYDDFRLSTDSIVTGFDYVDYFVSSTPADYIETVFSIHAGDPFSTAPLASGTLVASVSSTGVTDEFLFQVTGLGIALAAGDYWLGISNTVTPFGSTTVARVADPGGGLDASKQSDGVTDFDYPGLENRAFRIEGTVVPEPTSGALALLGLAGLAWQGRRRRV